MATLPNTVELLTDVIDAFKVRFPMLTAVSTNFSSEEARLGDTVRGRIASVPAASTYDGTTGYKNGATSANSLTADVSVTLNQHKHVPVKVDYIDQISTRRDLYNEVVGQMAYSIGKDMTDYILGLVVEDNFSHEVVASELNSDYDVLATANQVMNANGAAPTGRVGIVNSGVFNALETDARIASGDYHGQQRGGNAYGQLSNVGGFESIFEYPDLPTNSEHLKGFFTDKTGIVLAARVPTDMDAVAQRIGVPSIAKTEVVQDPDTGLSLMSIVYQDPHTFDLYATTTLIYGAVAGANAGDDNSGTDKGGLRLVSTAQSSGAFTNPVVNYGA